MGKQPLDFSDADYLEALRRRKVAALHIHWDGSIPAEDLFALAQRKKRIPLLPEYDIHGNSIMYKSEKERMLDTPEKLRAFQMGLLRAYSLADVFSIPISLMQTREDLREMAIAHCRYLLSQNIPYAESRFAPQYHCRLGLSLDQVIGYAVEGFEEGREETGVIVKPIICIGRESPPELGIEVVKASLYFEGKVVGIDLACIENGNPPEKHYPAFALTFGTFLKRTVHAGEMCSEEENLRNVHTSLTLLQADGLGHAIPLGRKLYQRQDLLELILRKNVRLESCPISNYNFFISDIKDLNLDVLLKEGVLVTISPDDPAMWPFGDMSHNLYAVGKLYGGQFLNTVIQNSFKSAWGLQEQAI
ncbi:hypothetical protein HY501_01160 [Candidatus Woesearchaeota archaeon]|nr:hypothetical protein [Candidatus Woesearchaeota archaeon]